MCRFRVSNQNRLKMIKKGAILKYHSDLDWQPSNHIRVLTGSVLSVNVDRFAVIAKLVAYDAGRLHLLVKKHVLFRIT